ncbi:hypothetical protein MINTM008_18350 [Mycobacterium intracellulare]|nr:hypothetical protein MINTM002_15840 [Mycobacterium intracellulare]BCO61740.1 hypothetical protein MINTM006_16900 [Mycobacterium intracellulare]BCO66958.1 hypothetical protein MINTM007_15690 [Mycobacterium intracellulare]BCO72500.1 hypothetical protein MINTM008_18350 [Mycobacterium intracellulare]BCO77950.1 hypothetical protein MINTM009_17320 [Mycobacterium intracellulare]
MGCVPYGPRHPQNDDSTISTPATPYTETRTHPAGAGTPDRRHGFTARRFVTLELPCCVVKKQQHHHELQGIKPLQTRAKCGFCQVGAVSGAAEGRPPRA